jgi:hypothetical protein
MPGLKRELRISDHSKAFQNNNDQLCLMTGEQAE